ncbi:MAG: sterol desaturase family protein [Calditrichaeota bacterium]|nr:MAG: sterol desaturase family protein [Calditrichota bacterium]
MPDLIHMAIPAFILLMIVEAVVGSIQDRELYEPKDTAASLAMGIGNVLIKLGWKGVIFGAYMLMYQHRLFDIPVTWWAWVLLFFLEDLTFYVFHRVSHECRFFWASHVNHHSSQRFNLSTALRQSWTGVLTGFIFWLWLPLLGFHPLMVMTMQALSLLYQFWIHTETIDKLGPLEWVLNTPSHHRVHHASNLRYLDRNLGGVLIIWDRLFGTFEEEKEKPVYGLTKNIYTYNPIKIAFHEWQDMWEDVKKPNPWWVRLSYMFRAPGWSPDGSRKTVKQMREEAARMGIREQTSEEAA